MKICPTCGTNVTVLIINVQNHQQFCHHCSGVVCPTFLPHVVFTEDDVKLLRTMGVDPEVGTIEDYIKQEPQWSKQSTANGQAVQNAPGLSPESSLLHDRQVMGNEISMGEADLILEKLYSESIPVVAYYVRGGVKVMRHGVVAGVSSFNGESSIIVGDREDAAKENIPLHDYIAVAPGSTKAGCTFWYGDKRELPDKTRAETVEKLGDTVLAIECADGGRLQLYFSL